MPKVVEGLWQSFFCLIVNLLIERLFICFVETEEENVAIADYESKESHSEPYIIGEKTIKERYETTPNNHSAENSRGLCFHFKTFATQSENSREHNRIE